MSEREPEHHCQTSSFQCYHSCVSLSAADSLLALAETDFGISQIHNACKQANDLDMRQANAVEARINLDLRIGAAFTRLTSLGLQARLPELAQQVISYGELPLLN